MVPDELNTRKLEEFDQDIATLERSVAGLGHAVAGSYPEHSLLAFQGEWHVRAALYHLRRLSASHAAFVDAVAQRAGTGASAVIMYSPEYQEMLFEFYALVSVCRISLDNLRVYLSPMFASSGDQLPNSVRQVLAGTSDCPVYVALREQPLVDYLLDIRNCLVHYRSFATSDNAYIVEEGQDLPPEDASGAWLKPMARGTFRLVGEDGISVNVLLPDLIFEDNGAGGRRLAEFTYEERWHILSMSLAFARLSIGSVAGALRLLGLDAQPTFVFTSGKRSARS